MGLLLSHFWSVQPFQESQAGDFAVKTTIQRSIMGIGSALSYLNSTTSCCHRSWPLWFRDDKNGSILGVCSEWWTHFPVWKPEMYTLAVDQGDSLMVRAVWLVHTGIWVGSSTSCSVLEAASIKQTTLRIPKGHLSPWVPEHPTTRSAGQYCQKWLLDPQHSFLPPN